MPDNPIPTDGDLIRQFNAYLVVIQSQFRRHSDRLADNTTVSEILALESVTEIAQVQQIHYARQLLIDPAITSLADIALSEDGYILMPDSQNAFHRSGDGQEGNIKWLSADGHQEFITRAIADGYELVDVPVNVGTFNFASTNDFFYTGLDTDYNGLHWELDVAPWLRFGNLPDDSSTTGERAALLLGSGLPYIGGRITGFLDGLNGHIDARQNGSIEGETLSGRTGVSDTERNDALYGYGGDDTLIGGGGADLLDGGRGTDTASYRWSGQGVIVDLRPGAASVDMGASGLLTLQNAGRAFLGEGSENGIPDILNGIENVEGSDFHDILIGNAEANELSGFAGDDTLFGGVGNDLLNGGYDEDVVRYMHESSRYVISRSGNIVTVDGSTVGDGTDTLQDVEILRFSDRDVWTATLGNAAPVSGYASSFRAPVGNGTVTPAHDGDGYYVAQGFDAFNADFNGHHLGVDWNGEGGGHSDLGDPIYAIANATVVRIVPDQSAATTGYGNYVILRHDFAEPTLINGQSVTHVHSLYAHLDTVEALTLGQEISIGQQIGTMGTTGNSQYAHLHFEITLGDTLPTSGGGYSQTGAGAAWVDPVAFIDNFVPTAPTGAPDGLTDSQAILAGTFLARAVYGGSTIREGYRGSEYFAVDLGSDRTEDPFRYDDDYTGYLGNLSSNPWTVLTTENGLDPVFFRYAGEALGDFTAGGLYQGYSDQNSWFNASNHSEALLARTNIDGTETLVLAFRGTDGSDGLWEGQTFVWGATLNYYEALMPLIRAALAYASDENNGIDSVVVAGHSLGGTMADLFSAMGSGNTYGEGLGYLGAEDFQDALAAQGTTLDVVSFASAGLDTGVDDSTHFAAHVALGPSNAPFTRNIQLIQNTDWYHALSHSQDRVYFAENDALDGLFNNLSPNGAIDGNTNVALDYLFHLPNIENNDAEYYRLVHDRNVLDLSFELRDEWHAPTYLHGFGAEHNSELYWANVEAFFQDPLFTSYGGQSIVFGISDYGASTRDYDGTHLPLFGAYTGGYGADNDVGDRALQALNGDASYVLGLSGNDQLLGGAEGDLLSGGAGADDLYGHGGLDMLDGGIGNDDLFGGAGNDTLAGGAGSDRLVGGAGSDHLTGGAGRDIYVFQTEDYPPQASISPDRITDYNRGNTGVFSTTEGDLIDLSGMRFDTANGFGTAATVRLQSAGASADLPQGALLEVNTGDNVWRALAHLDNVLAGQSVEIALTEDQAQSLIGTSFRIDDPGYGTAWTISPESQSVSEVHGRTLSFTITRSAADYDQTVFVSTVQTFGSTNERDYIGLLDERVDFAAGEHSQDVEVRILGNATPEFTETFGLIAQFEADPDPDRYLALATFSILDNDTFPIQLEVTDGDDVVVAGFQLDTLHGGDGTDQLTLDYSGVSA
ncbi:peptidoglycan DD-metalloendopeptidase family protein, partial [Shimia sp. SDUM112013]|uniref:peptidoglycan DD-metalloendopeptidase family protein n=1 Tax=Shimia sp. SDUM112013 TaxID=3136160 RepID=UPI0032ED43B8